MGRSRLPWRTWRTFNPRQAAGLPAGSCQPTGRGDSASIQVPAPARLASYMARSAAAMTSSGSIRSSVGAMPMQAVTDTCTSPRRNGVGQPVHAPGPRRGVASASVSTYPGRARRTHHRRDGPPRRCPGPRAGAGRPPRRAARRPPRWPCASLTSLNPSRSTNSTTSRSRATVVAQQPGASGLKQHGCGSPARSGRRGSPGVPAPAPSSSGRRGSSAAAEHRRCCRREHLQQRHHLLQSRARGCSSTRTSTPSRRPSRHQGEHDQRGHASARSSPGRLEPVALL